MWVLWVSESWQAAVTRSPDMAIEPLVQELLDEISRLRVYPRAGLRRLPRAAARGPPPLAADVRRQGGARCVLPAPGSGPGPTIPPFRGMRAPTCRRSRATTWRRSSAAGAWAWSTRPGTAGSTASSPSRCSSPAPTPGRPSGAVPARSGGGGEPAPREHRRGL